MDLHNGVQPPHTLLDRYADYLRSERSRTEPTVTAHREHVAAFLKDVGDSPTELSRQMSASYVLAFFTQRAQGKRLTMRRRLQGVLRSFLRFCFQKGYLDRDLGAVIPCIRSYKLSGVPRGISEPDALKTLECIDRTTPKGRRDFAIIHMLHCYGVRGGQVRAMNMKRKALESCEPPQTKTAKALRQWSRPSILQWLDQLSRPPGNNV